MYYLFILAIGAERLIEMVVSRRNANWSFANGGKEFGRGHFPVMVGMHTLLLVACIAEVAVFHRPFLPWLGWPMVGVVVLSTVDAVVVCRGARKALEPAAHRHSGRASGASRAVSLPTSSQLHGGDRGSGGAARLCIRHG